MGTSTPNFDLYKPDGSEFVDEETDLNENWDKVDAALQVLTLEDVDLNTAVAALDVRLDTAEASVAAHETRLDNLLTFINKDASETVLSSTAYQDDNDFFFAVEANSRYILEAVMIWESSGASGLKGIWQGPAGIEFHGVSLMNSDWIAFSADPAPEVSNAGAGIGSFCSLEFNLQIVTDATAGTVKFRWAQTVSNPTNTRIRSNSFLKITKVA